MSARPREYSLNFDAANELEDQAARAKTILERLAAHLAATQQQRNPDFKDLVELEHVRQAADWLFGSARPLPDSPSHDVFVSFSGEDESFIPEQLCIAAPPER